MASTVVYQSYFESQHFEPRALRLKLSSPNNIPLKSHSIDSSITTNTTTLSSLDPNSNSNSSSWSFLESLSNLNSNNDDDDKDQKKTLLSYIQPPSSHRTLSDESLALCTESLGSETGSDVMKDQDLFLVSSETERRTSSTTSRTSKRDKKMNVIASLPPPLTSMRGIDCIQVKSHRVNGRLVMMATKPPPRNRCLQDRSNGCVRLAILIDSNEHIETETKEETIQDQYKEEDEEEEDIEVMGLKKIQRSRRCHGENRVFLNMESLCVATS